MPAHTPGRREAMEAALPLATRRALVEVCGALGIPVDRWHLVPAVSRPFEQAAAAYLAKKIETEEGRSETEAMSIAATRLGLAEGSVLSRGQRWIRRAYGGGKANA